MADKILFQKQTTDVEELRVTVGVFKGKKTVHIRYYWDQCNDGNFIPTKKGASIPLDSIDAVIEALQKAKAE